MALKYLFIIKSIKTILPSTTKKATTSQPKSFYRLGIISLEHAPVHVTDFPVVNVHVDKSNLPA
jgi:hypothetical protein